MRLPADLRNMIYEYIVGKNSYREKLVFNNGAHVYKDRAISESKCNHSNNGRTAILRVNHQVHNEATAFMYEQNTFYIELDDESPVMDVMSYGATRALVPVHKSHAIPFGWALSRITHHCIGIVCYSSFSFDSIKRMEFRLIALSRMTNLRTLCFHMSTVIETVIRVSSVMAWD